MTDQIFCYVPHSRQKQFEELGWEFETDLGYPHACYASMYKWKGDGDPIYPREEISIYKNTIAPQDKNND